MQDVSPVTEESGVYSRSIHGGKWFLASAMMQKALMLVTFFVLARLLVPADYGILSIILLVPGMFGQLTTISFGDALTQRQDSIEKYLDPNWTFDLLRNTLLAIIIVFVSGPLAHFFNLPPNAVPLLTWSGVFFLILPSFSNIRQIYLFKELAFKKIFFRDLSTQLAFSVVAIGWAVFVQANVVALFVGTIARTLVGVISGYVIYPSRPRFSFRFRRLLDLLGFSKWVFGQEILEVFLAQIDKILVGRFLTPTDLGLFTKAKDLASTANATIASLMQKVGFAAFAKVQNQPEKIREGFKKVIDILLLVSVPMTLLLLLEGRTVVMLFLGEKWLALVAPLQLFAFGNLFLSIVNTSGPVLSSLGRPDIVFRMNAIRVVVSVPLMTVGIVYFGVVGLAWAIVATWVAMLGYLLVRARNLLPLRFSELAPSLGFGLFASAGVGIVDAGFRAVGSESVPLSIVKLLVLSVCYFVLLGWMSQRRGHRPYATAMSVFRELRRLR